MSWASSRATKNRGINLLCGNYIKKCLTGCDNLLSEDYLISFPLAIGVKLRTQQALWGGGGGGGVGVGNARKACAG